MSDVPAPSQALWQPVPEDAPRPAAQAGQSDGTAWLLTFTDLVALLLAFFVMLFAMSKVDTNKWQNLTDALAEGLNSLRQESAVTPYRGLDVAVVKLTAGQDLDYLASLFRQRLPDVGPRQVRRYSDGLVVTLPPPSAGAESEAQAQDPLFRLAGLLRQLRNRVEVVAYAGAEEAAEQGVSPWDLAMARALDAGERLRASGYQRDVILRGRVVDERTGRVDLVVRRDAAEEP